MKSSVSSKKIAPADPVDNQTFDHLESLTSVCDILSIKGNKGLYNRTIRIVIDTSIIKLRKLRSVSSGSNKRLSIIE